MSKKKNFLLHAIPRSGSTPVFQVLTAYLQQVEGVSPLSEYFNHAYQDVWGEANGIRTRPRLNGSGEPFEAAPEVTNRRNAERMALLAKYPNRYFFKVLTHQVNGAVLESLISSSEWIFVERRDLFNHYLSYLISAAKRQWYEPGGIRAENGSLPFDENWMRMFQDHFFAYLLVKRRVRPKRVVYYEDLETPHGHEKVLRQAGFNRRMDLTQICLPERQNPAPPEEKLILFKDPQAVLLAYQNSPLNHIRPV